MHIRVDPYSMKRAGAVGRWCLMLLLAACTNVVPPPPKAFVAPVFPPAPEPARVVYERTIYSSADVLRDNSELQFKRWVTGEQRIGDGFAKPYGVAARAGRVYVTDTVRRIVMVFNFVTGTYREIGHDDPGGLKLPIGVDVDANGLVYASDSSLRAVMVYGSDGRFIRQLGVAADLQRPAGLAVTADGARVYVVDIAGIESEQHQVVIFDGKTGSRISTFGKRGSGPGEFNLPRDLAIGNNGELYVVDGANFRVQVFDRDGKFLRMFGEVGRQGGQFSRPKEIATDRDGNVYVVDTAFGNFQIFNAAGQLLLDVGSRSNTDGPAKYMLPAGITVDEDGRIYVVDQYFRKIDVYRPAALSASAGFLGRALPSHVAGTQAAKKP